jgi:1-acyl-sn-glycerol-3-phosphate acyltransferase
MIWFRSSLFNIAFLVFWTPLVSISFIPFLLLPLPIHYQLIVGKVWAYGSLFLLRIICGIRHEIKGLEHIPNTACIIASKHQSAWDTIIFFLVVSKPAYVLKKELCRIPLFGQYLIKMQMIAVNRKEGSKALKHLTSQAAHQLMKGREIVIFPEGTRAKPGESPPLHPGIAAIYSHPDVNVPVVPAVLDSGVFWGRDSFLKYPGTITLQFLPAIEPGLGRKDFMKRLENTLHTESERLTKTA